MLPPLLFLHHHPAITRSGKISMLITSLNLVTPWHQAGRPAPELYDIAELPGYDVVKLPGYEDLFINN
jgi:hypothetical protein